jgi:hypothetical protein
MFAANVVYRWHGGTCRLAVQLLSELSRHMGVRGAVGKAELVANHSWAGEQDGATGAVADLDDKMSDSAPACRLTREPT